MAIKRKSSDATNPNPSRRLRQVSPVHGEDKPTEPDASSDPEVPDASDSDAANATQPDYTDTEGDGPVDPGKAYEETKALGDVDRKVRVCFSSQICYRRFAKFLGHAREVEGPAHR